MVWTAALFLLSRPALAEHPKLLLDSTELAFIRAKVANNTSDWRALKEQCDSKISASIQWPHAISGTSDRFRGMVVKNEGRTPLLYTGFHGGLWDKAITQLGVCYQALKLSDSKTAESYLHTAHYIIQAMAQPLIQMVRQSDGMVRYAVSTDRRGFDLKAKDSPQLTLVYDGAVGVGDIWTVRGATGCTSLNNTWKVASKKAWSIYFSNADGSAAAALNADCTLYSVAFGDYASRFYMPALAKAYDWFYDGLAANYPADLKNLQAALTAWGTEMSYCPTHQISEDNYAHSYLWALAAEYIVVNADLPALSTLLNEMLTTKLNAMIGYRERWFAGGGAGEGWQAYGYGSIRRMLNAELAMKIAGVDWSQPPYNFTLLNDTLQYFMAFTTPSKLALDDNEYVYPLGTSYLRGGDTAKGYQGQWFPTESVYIPLTDAVMYAAMATRFGSVYAGKFQSWYNSVYASEKAESGKLLPEWAFGSKPYYTEPELTDEFLWSGQGATPSDWTTLPLMYRAYSGNYAVTRSDWTNTATEVTFLGGPSGGAAGNGKTQFDSGAITIQRGNNRLLVYGLGEASRATDVLPGYTLYNKIHRERGTYGNKKNSIWWAAANSSQVRNQGLTSRLIPPGQKASVTTWPSSIDRAEDKASYSYFRASHLEANGASSEIDHQYHQVDWTRELFFLRPKLVIVHDRTATLNDNDDRAMFWTFGRNLMQESAPSGMTRYDASFKGVYRGAFTSVLPLSPSVSVVDHDDKHFLYRVEVRPPAMDHKNDRWLAVLDAADSPHKVTPVVQVAATNADAVQLNDARSTVVAFSQSNPPTLPMTIAQTQSAEAFVAGLNPSTKYKVTFRGEMVTVAVDDGTSQMTSSEAGILRIPHQ
jgi:hypothetical protein